MAKRPTSRTNERQNQPGDELVADEPLEKEERALQNIIDAREESGQGVQWRVKVTRLAGPEKRDGGRYENQLFQQEVEELPNLNSYIAAEYGEGTYRVRVYKERGIFSQWDIVIELSPAQRTAFREKVRALGAAPVSVGMPVAATFRDGTDPALMAILQQQSEMMRQLIERDRAPVQDPMTVFSGVAGAFKTFQDLMPKNEAVTGLQMFEKGMEMMERLGGGGGAAPRTGILDVLREALGNPQIGEVVGKVVQTIAAPQPQPQEPQPQQRRPLAAPMAPRPAKIPPPVDTHAQPMAPAPQQDEVPQALMNQALDYLCNQARAGAQPQLFTDQALDMIPNGLLDELERSEDMMAFLIERFPQIEGHRPWFEALLADMFPPQEGPATNADTPPPADQFAQPAALPS